MTEDQYTKLHVELGAAAEIAESAERHNNDAYRYNCLTQIAQHMRRVNAIMHREFPNVLS